MGLRIGSLITTARPRPSRRQFVQGSAAALAGPALFQRGANAVGTPGRHTGAVVRRAMGLPERVAERVDPAVMKQLALTAIDAAKAAGATYADVRLTRRVKQGEVWMIGIGPQSTQEYYPRFYRKDGGDYFPGMTGDQEDIAVGVRCLVNGYWGFAASPYWRREEMGALARHAVAQAMANTKTGARSVELTAVPVVTGEWTMPVKIDPFTVPMEERLDFFAGLTSFIMRRELVTPGLGGQGEGAEREERAVATTDGSYVLQTFFRTGDPLVGWMTKQPLGPTTQGWELYSEAAYTRWIEEWESYMRWLSSLPVKPFELGRYDMVATGKMMGNLVSSTLGPATELDRALGYEATATGTSYLGPNPLDLLGHYQVGSAAVTLTADRSTAGGRATVQWDDEGVVPDTAPLVTEGILTDYQTTREQAGWLAPYYEKAGRPVRSHGFAGSTSAMYISMQAANNLTLHPASQAVSEDALIANVKKGIYLFDGGTSLVDFQCNTGSMIQLQGREIVDGRLGPLLAFGDEFRLLFTSKELWKNVVAVGGPATVETASGGCGKGRPHQSTSGTVWAAAAHVRNVTVVQR